MAEHITVPVKIVNGVKWGDLNALGLAHEVCAESFKQKKDLSFAGGHRVRHFYFKKNVHWRLSAGLEVDIEEVKPADTPRAPARRNGRNR